MEERKRYFIGIIAKNETDILTRIIEVFGMQKTNIESFNADMIDPERNLVRITSEVCVEGAARIDKICSVLSEIPLVYKASRLDFNGLRPVQRDLALIKFTGDSEERGEAIRLVNRYNGRLVDFTEKSIIFEVVKNKSELYHLVTILEVLGEVEYTKTGTLAITRGDDKFVV